MGEAPHRTRKFGDRPFRPRSTRLGLRHFPSLKPYSHGIVWVAAFTDLKLQDITTGAIDPNAEPFDQNQPAGTPKFLAGNTKFITRKLWGVGNSGPYMLHGKFTTMCEAILAHSGEALASRQNFEALSAYNRDCLIEYSKAFQILPPGTRNLIVNEKDGGRSSGQDRQ